MLDPIVSFVTKIFELIGRGFGQVIAWLLFPFIWVRALYKRTHGIMKVLLAILLLCIIIPYGWFFWNVAWIRNFDVNYTDKIQFEKFTVSAGGTVTIDGNAGAEKTCGRSAIVDVEIELLDFSVNQNAWMSATLLYKLGLFGVVTWDATPWMDNKASFQRGVHRAITSTSIELQETLGRVRGTSERDGNLNNALSNIQISEFNWYMGLNPPGVKQTSWASYRQAIKEFKKYNDRLESCGAFFDARADNLSALLDRIAKDIGSTTAVIKDRAEQYDSGWFDTRADNVFMGALGQLYGYAGVLRAARVDFQDIIENRALGSLWDNMLSQIDSAIELDPLIISNGKEDGFIMPTHLTTMGFYILRVRTNLTEMRDVLKH
ncbi:MAG: hypothetical protein COB78_04145 [Hyphomicrobiales bacterium]|nr:MAG: hypothetical protein COB78_04145 [Hyphomicrobiales bacterium]